MRASSSVTSVSSSAMTRLLWSSDVKEAFNEILFQGDYGGPDVKFLNMESINRLSAIAKMLVYCIDNKISVEEFVTNRTYQRINSHIFAAQLNPTNNSEIQKRNQYFPSREEFSFLRTIKGEDLNHCVCCLMTKINSSSNLLDPNDHEKEFHNVMLKNKFIIKKILNKMQNDKKPQPLTKPHVLLNRAKDMLKKIKRKNSRIKRRKIDN